MDAKAAPPSGLLSRKDSHLDLVLAGAGVVSARTGFDDIRFVHCALPEIALADIDLSTRWLGYDLSAPLMISSMTGGAVRAEQINHNLAVAAQALGIPFAVGSQRVALEGGSNSGLSQRLRDFLPSVPLLSNIGAAQLLGPQGFDQARRVVEAIGADALIVHLNPLQEALQPGGDTNWRGVLDAISRLSAGLQVPVVAKEVGAGLSPQVVRRLVEAGVQAVDVAGAGGTSWAAIEGHRGQTDRHRRVAQPFADWGIPTAEAVAQARAAAPHIFLIGSGGIRTGLDAAKAIRLGADLIGQAAYVLETALISPEAVIEAFEITVEQLRVACFCTGSQDLASLRRAPMQSTRGDLR
ncbi:MAG TPA: type 2 isopentenyl-diphosphate Delta-isomerase [Tianweitania sediminis]|nr:type 2 isopentenyl-diphosphate Delta-isomerase [Tianweitania sediminis]